jgi:hypothetical protein
MPLVPTNFTFVGGLQCFFLKARKLASKECEDYLEALCTIVIVAIIFVYCLYVTMIE